MRRIIKYLFIFVFFFFGISLVNAKEVTMEFFYGYTCPHCAKEEIFLEELEKKYGNLTIIKYETYKSEENNKLLKQRVEELKIEKTGVPLTIVEDKYVLGYTESFNEKIEQMVIDASIEDRKIKEEVGDFLTYNLPLIGKINVKETSLFLISIVLGLVDGFNPCAMWVLLFLLSMLVGMKDKKRMWLIGLTFLITSALVYMLMMLSWIEIVSSIKTSVILRNIIAIIALVGAVLNFRGYLKSNKSGCNVIDDKKRTKIFTRIKNFTTEKSLILALLGVILLAVSINIIELACSAGIPIMFSSILGINNVTSAMIILYTIVYIFFFLLDDLIIFSIAMITLKVTGISTKYSKYSKLIGAIFMLLIGLVLLIKPEWAMFNFN